MSESGPSLYTDNAVSMFDSLAGAVGRRLDARPDLALFEITPHRAAAALVRRPTPADARGAVATMLDEYRGRFRVLVEDPYGQLRLEPDSAPVVLHLPVMVRMPAALQPRPKHDIRVAPVAEEDELAVAERTIVNAYPLSSLQPVVRGAVLSPVLLGRPGWTVWLATRAGQPAGGCFTFHSAGVTGLYWMATLPEHRLRGVARAMVEAVLTANRGDPMVLVATPDSVPLYTSAGFIPVSTATWRIWPAEPSSDPP